MTLMQVVETLTAWDEKTNKIRITSLGISCLFSR